MLPFKSGGVSGFFICFYCLFIYKGMGIMFLLKIVEMQSPLAVDLAYTDFYNVCLSNLQNYRLCKFIKYFQLKIIFGFKPYLKTDKWGFSCGIWDMLPLLVKQLEVILRIIQ